jgi:pyruvate dehydrogenase E2 component (dihydrolipoamide acetyltransferase)
LFCGSVIININTNSSIFIIMSTPSLTAAARVGVTAALLVALCATPAHSFGVVLPSAAGVARWSLRTPSLNMAEPITMPALSSTMKEGRVVSWLKSEGDAIGAGDAIMVVESDKADMDVEAFEEGFLAKILTQEGDMAPVGQVVALVAALESEIPTVIAAYEASVNGGGPAAPVAEAAAPPAAGEFE